MTRLPRAALRAFGGNAADFLRTEWFVSDASATIDPMDDERERSCRADELDAYDIGRRITFKRLHSDTYDRPTISGRLIAVRRITYLVGYVHRQGLELVIGFPRRMGGENRDTISPVPLAHQVRVGPQMRERKDPFFP